MRLLITILQLKFKNSEWRMQYGNGVFTIADYDFDVKNGKFKMTAIVY